MAPTNQPFFIEVTDTSIGKKVMLNATWIKAVFPLDDKTAIILGDGYQVPINEEQPERYLVKEAYADVMQMLVGNVR
jgi:hypothetical protein